MTWDSIFQKDAQYFTTAGVHKDFAKILSVLKKRKARRVLDLGCGAGRHAVALAKEGFEVHAFDASAAGVEKTKARLVESGLKAEVVQASCFEEFPYPDGFFDAVISIQVIYHGYHDQIKFCISEIARVVKPGGVVFVTFASKKDGYNREDRAKYKEVAENTYVPDSGIEEGIVHYLYPDEASLRKDFSMFKVLDVFLDDEKHICLLAEK